MAVDLLDRASVIRAVREIAPTRIYHLAGAPRTDTSWVTVVPHLETNVLGTRNLFDAVRGLDAPCRVLVVSSAMVYRNDQHPVSEDTPLVPSSPYGLSKLAQDALCDQACSAEGLDVVVARPFNHTGPRQRPDFAVPSFARQVALIEAGKAAPEILVGDLDVRRDLSDVRDVVGAYERIMERAPAGRAYNICSGQALRIGDLLDELLRQANVAAKTIVDPKRLRPVDASVFVGDASRARRELDWSPRIPLSQTIGDTLDWWRSQVAAGR
jgi:GDP-4-dehydro-6-deoxy-D-mannose reductase